MLDKDVLNFVDDILGFIEDEQQHDIDNEVDAGAVNERAGRTSVTWHALERVRSYVKDRTTMLKIKQVDVDFTEMLSIIDDALNGRR